MTFRLRSAALVVVASLALAGCKSQGDLVVEEGIGVTAIRTLCPAVGVADYTGDVTLFRQPGDKSLASLDTTAVITNVRTTCNEQGAQVYSEASFDVVANRRDTAEARSVDLPYFVSVLQGGSAVVSKQVGTVRVNFAAGQERGTGSAKAGAYVDAAAATLPAEIREKITRRRKAGDTDAALDPLADPEVKAAIARATFEMLVGFQLTQDQLAYNATR